MKLIYQRRRQPFQLKPLHKKVAFAQEKIIDILPALSKAIKIPLIFGYKQIL